MRVSHDVPELARIEARFSGSPGSRVNTVLTSWRDSICGSGSPIGPAVRPSGDPSFWTNHRPTSRGGVFGPPQERRPELPTSKHQPPSSSGAWLRAHGAWRRCSRPATALRFTLKVENWKLAVEANHRKYTLRMRRASVLLIASAAAVIALSAAQAPSRPASSSPLATRVCARRRPGTSHRDTT